MRAAIDAVLKQSSVRISNGAGIVTIEPRAARLPMPVAFGVALRQGDRTWHVGRFATNSTSVSSWAFGVDLRGAHVGKADLIFTSDAAAAAGTIDVTRAWRGEIVVRDVSVTPQP